MNVPDIQPGSDSRRNWGTINDALAILRTHDSDSAWLRQAVAELRRIRGAVPDDDYPFQVYTIPPSQRLPQDQTPNWWRLFTVQHGYVNNVKTATTDDADGEWGVDQTIEITVPPGVSEHFIWVESSWDGSKVTANTIQSGSAPWTGFPVTMPSGKIETLLARIDTLTNLSYQQAIVRQFVFSDITLTSGGGGDAIWLP